MKLKNLLKLYKLSKNWDIINDKLSIPDYDLPKLDIREGDLTLNNEANPFSKSGKGEYLPPMTEEDFTKWKAQTSGWQKFYDKVLGKNAN